MFSNITPVNRNAKPREAEKVDARLAMHRHASEYNKNRGKKKHIDHSDIFGEDSATVSTDSLLAFLEDYLAARFGDTVVQNTERPTQENTTRSPLSAERPGRAQHAAQAYAHAAKTAHNTQTGNQNTLEKNDASGDARMITTLIKELKLLSRANIKQIEIGRGNSFLGSLVQSVGKAREEHEAAS